MMLILKGMKKTIKLILWIGIMGLIFYFSSQPSNDSTIQTNFIIDAIYKIYLTLAKVGAMSYERFVEVFFTPVRKLAHFSEFAVLGILTYLNIIEYHKNNAITISVIFVCLYAISDEIHQMFVPGRACMFMDVLIDCSGAIFGIFLIHLLMKRCLKKY